ncbi:MAG: M48 family metalloprotease, partial [Chitinophagales bacterium]|nr:M48 family metalloprotease [Chitinophagales bacterium]
MRTFILSVFILGSLNSFSQSIDFKSYSGLYSAGSIPDDFTILSSAKYQAEKQKIDADKRRRERKAEDQFFLESSFLMDNLLHSGRVIFGDPVTEYLNQIKDILLKDEPELRKTIRIYTYRNTDANAFTANNGVVLVTTGLLAQCENEAQIAFILCHEFNHYIKNHALNSYMESQRMERGDGIYKSLNRYDVEDEQLRYSKELELEADQSGVTLYKKSNYSIEAVRTAFDVLLYSYLPFNEIEFDKNYFNRETFKIPDDYFLDTVQTISAEEDYNDKESSHPNIKKRKEAAMEELGIAGNSGKKEFLISEETFHYVQKICRYEAVRLYLSDVQYEDALYTNYLLMLDEPDNPVLQKNMAKALYAVSTYKTNRSYGLGMHRSYKKVEGNSQQVFYMTEKIPAKDFSVIALQYIWPLYQNNTEDKAYERMCNDLLTDITVKHKLKLQDFKTEYATDTVSAIVSPTASDSEIIKEEEEKNKTTVSKYQKIKKKEEEEKEEESSKTKTGDNAYWRYALVEILQNETFKTKFAASEKKSDFGLELLEKEGYGYNKKKDEYALGEDKIVIVEPYYMKVDELSDIPVKYEASEQAQIDLKNKIKESAKVLDMEVDFIESTDLSASDTEKFNELNILNDWL